MVKTRTPKAENGKTYEDLREARIRKNNEVLQSLGIQKIDMSTPKKRTPSKRRAPIKRAPQVPSRRSSRIADVGVKSADLAEVRAQAEKARLELEKEREKKFARVPGPIKGKDALIEYYGPAIGINELRAASELSSSSAKVPSYITKSFYDPSPASARWTPHVTYTTELDPESLKVTPERIFSVRFHPSCHRPILMIGDKRGHLGIWNARWPVDEYPSTSSDDDDIVSVYRPFKWPLSGIKVNPADDSKVFLSSYDGSIRVLDTKKEVFSDTFVDETTSLSYIAVGNEGNVVYASTHHGDVIRVDTREGITRRYEAHDRKIGCVDLHPDQVRLVTCSLDQSVRIWDIRQTPTPRKGASTDSALKIGSPLLIGQDNLSIQGSLFSPTGDHVLVTCNDDTVKIFATPEPATKKQRPMPSPSQAAAIVKHNNQTGRWVTNFRAEWSPNGDGFCIGNMKRKIDVYNVRTGKGKGGKPIITQGTEITDSEVITAIPAVNVYHPKLALIGSGNASGRCHVVQRS